MSKTMEFGNTNRTRLISLYIVHLAMFVFTLGFSIILTGLYPYLKELLPNTKDEQIVFYYGIIVAVNPLGQFISSPILGWLANKMGSVRGIALSTSLIYAGGSALYSIVTLFPEKYRLWILLLSRFTVGVSAGFAAALRSYLADATHLTERVTHMALIQASQSLGFTLGPAIQTALTPLACTDPAIKGDSYFTFDMYTTAGWLSVAAGFLMFVLFLPFIFKEVPILDHKAQKHTSSSLPPLDKTTLIGCLVVYFCFLFNFVLVETLGTPICMDHFGWSGDETILKFGILVIVNSCIGLVLFLATGPLCRRIDERLVLIFGGVVILFISRAMMIPLPGFDHPPIPHKPDIDPDYHLARSIPSILARSEEIYASRNVPCQNITATGGCVYEWCSEQPALTVFQLFGGFTVGSIGYPLGIAVTSAIFSKLLGARQQGLWMGLLTSSGSLARILGPIFISWIYHDYGMYFITGIMMGSMVVAFILTVVMYKNMSSAKIQAANELKPDIVESIRL